MAEMTSVTISAFGGPDRLKPVSLERPEPGEGEVLIRVAAAGLNGPDLLQRRGLYVPNKDMALRPGLEVSGIVEAAGPGTSRFAPGDRVVALTNGGGYAEFVSAPEGQVLPCPAGWRLADAAALPEVFFTIEQTLVMRAGIEKGMNVLVHGASGGLGTAALQVARLFGATTIATISSEDKAKYVLGRGADHLIAYPHEDFVTRVKELTDGHGADRIIDIVGGAYLRRNMEAAAEGATIVQLAFLAGAKSEIVLPQLLGKGLTLIGSLLGPQPGPVKAKIASAVERDLWPALASGEIGPPKISYFALEEAVAAHTAMEAEDHYGKVLLVTPFGLEN